MRGPASALCCLGHIVPFQFLEVSVQEEGSGLHKLVGDLVDSHRLLSLFVIVSPVLWEKTAVLASRGSLGQHGEWRTRPSKGQLRLRLRSSGTCQTQDTARLLRPEFLLF